MTTTEEGTYIYRPGWVGETARTSDFWEAIRCARLLAESGSQAVEVLRYSNHPYGDPNPDCGGWELVAVLKGVL